MIRFEAVLITRKAKGAAAESDYRRRDRGDCGGYRVLVEICCVVGVGEELVQHRRGRRVEVDLTQLAQGPYSRV